jgi:hypothetical protein
MVKLFLFFFARRESGGRGVLQQIVVATNAKGKEEVIKVKENGKWILRPPTGPDDNPDAERRKRSNIKTPPPDKNGTIRADGLAHNPLTAPELLVFLGARILMGRYWRQLLSMYWSTDPGDTVPQIATSMRENRAKEILSHLSFMEAGDSRWPSHPLRKIKEVDDTLKEQCKAAKDVEVSMLLTQFHA